MTFFEATDALMSHGIRQAEIAKALSIAPATVRAARLDRSSPNFREAPEGWEVKLAGLAKTRGGELEALAKKIAPMPLGPGTFDFPVY